jgi:hypothetical protein
VKAPRGKILALLVGSIGLAVLLGAAFASRDLILTTWYAHRLQSDDVAEQKAAITSLGQLRTRRAARILSTYLGEAKSLLKSAASEVLVQFGEVAMEPFSEAFQIVDDFAGEPRQISLTDCSGADRCVYEMLDALLEVQRKETGVRSLLENISSRFAEQADTPSGVYKSMAWRSGLQPIEGTPCRIFLFMPGPGWPGPQTILLTNVGGRVFTWKEVGEDIFRSCELLTQDGAVSLVVRCHSARLEGPEMYTHTYLLTLRGIEEQR